MAKMRLPRVAEQPPNILPEEHIRNLFKACEGRGFGERRDMAIVRLLIDTGMRRQEIANLMLGDLDRQLVTVVGKGGQVRVLTYGHKMARDLDRYLRLRQQRLPFSPFGLQASSVV